MTFIITICNWIIIPDLSLKMEKRIKVSKTSPNSLSIKLERHTSRWNQSDSFSSCSDDSGSYCNNYGVRKHLTDDNQAPLLSNRSRHSSGSSASSNMSCISDKNDHKPPLTLSSSTVNHSINSSVRNKELICSDTNSRSMEFNHKAIIHERIPCNNESKSPFRHNLRRNIRKKTCSCDCSATCATLVVRRFQEISKDKAKSKTVVSKTKVNSFMPNHSQNSSQHLPKPELGRKRRSEVEKLYASLHEIEWAKNFSPDNILNQFNIRQAASCSVFGRNSNRRGSIKKENRRDKVIKQSSPRKQIVNCKTFAKYNSDYCKNEYSSKPAESCSDSDRDTKPNKIEVFSVSTNFHQYKEIETSVEHNSKENINSHEVNAESDFQTFVHSPKVEENRSDEVIDSVEDEKAIKSCDSCETLSVISIATSGTSTNDFQSYSGEYHSNTELIRSEDEVEFSLIPSFFDLAEQGIRTVDACVRELGAEVVVSTCYEDTEDLPLLSAIKENETCDSSTSDTPPILEPYVDIADQPIPRMRTRAVTAKLKNSSTKHIRPFPRKQDQKTHLCFYKQKLRTKHLAKRKHLVPNIVKRKQIFNKYSKYMHSKRKYKNMPLVIKNSFEVNKTLSSSTSCDSVVNLNPSNQKEDLMTITTQPLTFERSELLYQTDSENKQTIVKSVNQNLSIYRCSNKMMLDYVTKDTTLYGTQNEMASCSSTKLSLAQRVQRSAQAIMLPKDEGGSNNSIGRGRREVQKFVPTKFVGFTTYYKSLVVTKNADYIQVMLKYTRSNTILFTLEGLNELTDVIAQVASDASCNVMIIHGTADCFCKGLDLKPLIGPDKYKVSTELAIAIQRMIKALAELRKPLVAVINGPAYGLGMTLLHHADVKIASVNAEFCMPHSRLGYMPEGGASLTLPQVVGPTVAMDLLMRGRTLTAREAYDVGLISEVLEARHLPQDLVTRVRTLAQNSYSAMEATKAMIQMSLHVNLPLILENEVKLLPRMWLTQPCQDAIQSAFASGFLPHD